MSREELVEDLAYVRALAEEGRHAPLLGGSFMMFWGALNGGAYLIQWALLNEYLPIYGGNAFAVLWAGYGIVAGIGMALLYGRWRDKPGHAAIANRVHAAIWRGAGIAIATIAAGCVANGVLIGDMRSTDYIMGPAFALFGAVMLATASVSGQSWLNGFALLSFAAALITLVFAKAEWVYLAASAFSLLVLIVPGLKLARAEPSTTV